MYFSKFNSIHLTSENSNLNLLSFNMKSISLTFHRYFWLFMHCIQTL